MEIKFKHIIPPLTVDERAQLEQNILRDGIREPLVVWGDILIDGHNRLEIAQKYGLAYQTTNIDFTNESEAKEWIILNQFGRRNISDYTRARLALELKPILADKAKATQGARTDLLQISVKSEPANTQKELATIAGVSHDTVYKVEKIETLASDEIKAKAESGELSINQAYQMVKRDERAAQKASVLDAIKASAQPDEHFVCGDSVYEMERALDDESIDCVITDPPYGIDYVSNYRVVENRVDRPVCNDTPEAAFSLWERTCDVISRKMKPDSHLYVFTSWKVLPQFIEITSRYFNIKNCLVWVKNNWSMGDLDGNYAEQYEIIIYATKGNKKLNGGRDTNVLNFDRVSNAQLLHSCEKPVKLIEYLLDKSTQSGDIVADPFAGSGTTLVACKNMGRGYWGCEIEQENYDVALGRLSHGHD
jgi:site-specific DNA-methyltransferase (adenine-specific)